MSDKGHFIYPDHIVMGHTLFEVECAGEDVELDKGYLKCALDITKKRLQNPT